MRITAICLNCGETKILPSNIIVSDSFCNCKKNNRQRVLLIKDISELETTKKYVTKKAINTKTSQRKTSQRRKLPWELQELLEAEEKKDSFLEMEQ